jgi:hypothetical protein
MTLFNTTELQRPCGAKHHLAKPRLRSRQNTAMQLGVAIANRVGEMKSHIIIIPIKYLIRGFQFHITL